MTRRLFSWCVPDGALQLRPRERKVYFVRLFTGAPPR